MLALNVNVRFLTSPQPAADSRSQQIFSRAFNRDYVKTHHQGVSACSARSHKHPRLAKAIAWRSYRQTTHQRARALDYYHHNEPSTTSVTVDRCCYRPRPRAREHAVLRLVCTWYASFLRLCLTSPTSLPYRGFCTSTTCYEHTSSFVCPQVSTGTNTAPSTAALASQGEPRLPT